ncbi:MAG: putative quinol monooxygenase [Terracidiphilus sp.]|jgi:quinol monooxygenase YgiN
MLLIVGTVRLSAESIEDARPRMAAMIQASRAEAGCLEYCYAEDVLEAGLIYIKERWTNRSALDDHFKSDHLAAWRETWQSLGIRDRKLYLYEVGEPNAI